MLIRHRFFRISLTAAAALASTVLAVAQARHAAPAEPALNDRDVAVTQSELIKLLKTSPTLTTVVSHDPTLLADQEYVSRNNPQLAQFLSQHPEVARNPNYFLFSHLQGEGKPDEALERAVWPDLVPPPHDAPPYQDIEQGIVVLFGVLGVSFCAAWAIRGLGESRRWNRAFKQQSEMHARLIDKFGSGQELIAYLGTEAGQRFLSGEPAAVNSAGSLQQAPSVVARVMMALQAGIVLVLLGIGCMLVRHTGSGLQAPMLILGTLVLMPGIGFIISAGVTWLLAARLGLMPQETPESDGSSRVSLANKDRQ